MQLGISHTRTLVTVVSAGHSKTKSSEKLIYPGHQSARGDPVRAGNSRDTGSSHYAAAAAAAVVVVVVE